MQQNQDENLVNVRRMTSEELAQHLRLCGRERAKAEGGHVYADEYRKIIHASLTIELERSESVSTTKAEKMARMTSDFKTAVDELVQATERKYQAYANYKEADIEVKRRLNKSFLDRQQFNADRQMT